MTRRELVKQAGVALAGGALLPLWLGAPRARAAAKGDPLLVVVFLRGGADGLHLVPPLGDPGYDRARAGLALGEPLPFAERFGLHPGLEGASHLVERGQLAAIVNAGSADASRSHFEAQDRMEAGESGRARLDRGWLARALGDPADAESFAAVALAGQLPLTLRGSGGFALGAEFGLPGASTHARHRLAAQYASFGGALGDAGTRALQALDLYEARLGRPERTRHRGRRPGVLLRDSARQLVDLQRAGLPVRAAFMESGGWDTHLRQGTEQGQMAVWIRDLGDALGVLSDGLGERDWRAVVLTEFGRTVRPNGSGGTDHGHGSVMLCAGPSVSGGVYGDWRGLDASALWQGRDLPVTTDYRSVLHEVLRAHLGHAPTASTFPGFEPTRLGLFPVS